MMFDDWKICEELAEWAIHSRTKLSALSELLLILRKFGFNFLPKDARTLLETPRGRKASVRSVHPGKYINIGIESGIRFMIKKSAVIIENVSEVVIDFSMDGVSINKSTSNVFWPIWCKIVGVGEPFLVGNYHSESGKPVDANSYMEEFVAEFKSLKEHGLTFITNDDSATRHVYVRVGKLRTDTPARCAMLGELQLIIGV